MSSDGEMSPPSSSSPAPLSCPQYPNAPKYGHKIPNRIFVGGIAANTTDHELRVFFSAYGSIKDTKIISDRAGISKGYGFVTFDTQEDADKIMKRVFEENESLIFKERKLNIGPAVRKQQALPRFLDPSGLPAGHSMCFTNNAVPYFYQNGMAIFPSPASDGAAYAAVPPAQLPAAAYHSAFMMQQPALTFVAQAQYPYTAAAAAQQWSSTQWPPRWHPQAAAPLPGAPQLSYYQLPPGSEAVYAMTAPQSYMDMTDSSSMVEAAHTEVTGKSDVPVPEQHSQSTSGGVHCSASSKPSHVQLMNPLKKSSLASLKPVCMTNPRPYAPPSIVMRHSSRSPQSRCPGKLHDPSAVGSGLKHDDMASGEKMTANIAPPTPPTTPAP